MLHIRNHFCLFLCLFLLNTYSLADEQSAIPPSSLSEDRYYLESDCPMPGIQEIILRKDGRFELSSYVQQTKSRTSEVSGHWQLEDNILLLSAPENTLRFQVKSIVHTFIRQKFLYLSFKTIPGTTKSVFDDCEFVDRRVLDKFLGRDKSPAQSETIQESIDDKQQQAE